MNLLALDTSTNACSAAVDAGGVRAERHVEEPRQHSRLLLSMIRELLAEAGTEVADLDAIVLGNGPGSFIGVRIAASVAQGLAMGAGLQLVPVSSLAAVAVDAFARSPAQRLVVAQDAHMDEVYLARFRRGADGEPVALEDVVLHGIGEIETLGEAIGGRAGWHAAGAAWQRYPELLRRNESRLAGVVDALLPRAACLLDLGATSYKAGAVVEPGGLVPLYVRMRVAKEPGATPP